MGFEIFEVRLLVVLRRPEVLFAEERGFQADGCVVVEVHRQEHVAGNKRQARPEADLPENRRHEDGAIDAVRLRGGHRFVEQPDMLAVNTILDGRRRGDVAVFQTVPLHHVPDRKNLEEDIVFFAALVAVKRGDDPGIESLLQNPVNPWVVLVHVGRKEPAVVGRPRLLVVVAGFLDAEQAVVDRAQRRGHGFFAEAFSIHLDRDGDIERDRLGHLCQRIKFVGDFRVDQQIRGIFLQFSGEPALGHVVVFFDRDLDLRAGICTRERDPDDPLRIPEMVFLPHGEKLLRKIHPRGSDQERGKDIALRIDVGVPLGLRVFGRHQRLH